jgi:hypothetical protein
VGGRRALSQCPARSSPSLARGHLRREEEARSPKWVMPFCFWARPEHRKLAIREPWCRFVHGVQLPNYPLRYRPINYPHRTNPGVREPHCHTFPEPPMVGTGGRGHITPSGDTLMAPPLPPGAAGPTSFWGEASRQIAIRTFRNGFLILRSASSKRISKDAARDSRCSPRPRPSRRPAAQGSSG